MAIPSIALAYKRNALMTATKVTTKPPSEAVLKARDDFYDFCCFMGKKACEAHDGVAQRTMYGRR